MTLVLAIRDPETKSCWVGTDSRILYQNWFVETTTRSTEKIMKRDSCIIGHSGHLRDGNLIDENWFPPLEILLKHRGEVQDFLQNQLNLKNECKN
ncbi:hypothetical protein [Methanolapillus millepedarum]|uniref:Uncharacterized protein n=1 Tax=Methanolapillus millepedarum TaxID=3028296 RepID=A0AA96V659_9EURY|nr:hypothetical protein MsAc7_17780 [Methanosarcinaceae archaeon Ac7]